MINSINENNGNLCQTTKKHGFHSFVNTDVLKNHLLKQKDHEKRMFVNLLTRDSPILERDLRLL